MPNLHILKQPLELMVPIKDRDVAYQCCLRATGRPIQMEFDTAGECVVFCFSNYMEYKAAEMLIREVFAEEIEMSATMEKLGAKGNQWFEWRLD